MHRARRCRPGGVRLSLRVLGLVLSTLPVCAAVGEPVDWLIVSLDLPEGARAFSIRAVFEGATEEARLPHAVVIALRGAVGGFAYDERPADPSYLATSGTLGSARVWVAPPERRDEATTISFALWSPDQDATTARALFLAPGLEASRATVTAYIDLVEGEYPVAVDPGSGSRAVTLAQLSSGLGATAGASSAGAGSATRTVATGIAGTLAFECALGPCESTWTSPTGASGTLHASGYLGSRSAYGADAFAGPAGAWTFDWQGVQYGESVALYAPVGEAASLFG